MENFRFNGVKNYLFLFFVFLFSVTKAQNIGDYGAISSGNLTGTIWGVWNGTSFVGHAVVLPTTTTKNVYIPAGIWQTNPVPSGTGRWTMLYTRVAYFNKNDLLRLYIYSDGAAANISDASLNIILLSQN